MAEILRIRCRGCQVKIKAPLKYQGRTIQCPQCGHEIKIPVLQKAAKTRTAKTQAAESADPAKPAASPAGAVAAAAVTPMIVDEAPTKPKPKPKPEPKQEEEPIELGDDAYVDDEDPWDVNPAEYDDFEDFDAPPKRKRKPPASATKRPAKRKKKPAKQESDDVDWVEQGSIWGGVAMMVGAVVWFVVGLKADILFYYPPILFILGIMAMVRGFMGD